MDAASLAALRAEGNELFQKGEFLRAAAAYTKALKAADAGNDPELAPIYSNRSAAFLKLGKARQALADADACLALRPEWDKSHYRRGTALELLERPAEAVAALERAAALAGGANKDIAARLKTLRRWVNSGVKPAAPAIPAPPATHGAPTPPVPPAASSGFKFAQQAASGAPKAGVSKAASWMDSDAADKLAAAVAAALPDPAAPLVALAAARSGRGDAATLARALATAAAAAKTPAAWALLAEPLFAALGGSAGRRREAADALEAFRAERTPGLAMPLLPDAASLVAAARCAAESCAVRRAALEAANARFLGAARRAGPEGALFDDADVAAMLRAGLADALLEAVASAGPAEPASAAAAAKKRLPPPDAGALREAAAGVFYNLCAHARRLWAADAAADAIYEQLCRLLDREGNPLDADTSDAAADEWDEAAAHAFLAPLASLLGSAAAPAALNGPLSLQKIRTNAMGAAQSPAAGGNPAALPGVLTVLALLERVAARGAAHALRGLASREEAAAMQRSVAARAQQYTAMAAAVAALELRSQDA